MARSAARRSRIDLREATSPAQRRPVPVGFRGGTMPVESGNAVFVPYDPLQRPVPGYVVPLYFWEYLNRKDLFPGGWLHDVGLPMTPLFGTTVGDPNGNRNILVQAFERSVLTYDPLKPTD